MGKVAGAKLWELVGEVSKEPLAGAHVPPPPPRWGEMVIATSKKTKDKELPLGARERHCALEMSRWRGAAVWRIAVPRGEISAGRIRTRTNTRPYDIGANAASRKLRACVARG